MADAPSKAMVSAMIELWDISAPGPDNLFSAPAFVRLREICQTEYPHAGHGGGPTFALGNALHSLGLPCGLPPDAVDLALPVDEATRRLDNAFRRRLGRRLHLCPLDLADDLPPMVFGPARVQHFSAAELLDLVDAARLKRVFPETAFDAKRLSQFRWLVVEESVEFQALPEARAVPVLFMDMRQDLGRIEPHKARLPQAVEDALFFLLLAPWEQWSTMPEVDWRGFRVPWVYTVDDDLFADMMRIVSQAHPMTFDDGFEFVGLEAVFDEGLTFIGHDLIALNELLHIVFNTVYTTLLKEAQARPKDFDLRKDYLNK